MSGKTYREAMVQLREALDILGPFRGPSGFHGGPDARVRVAEALAGRVVGGDPVEGVVADYVTADTSSPFGEPVDDVLWLTVRVLAADHRLHGITRGQAAGLDRMVWAS